MKNIIIFRDRVVYVMGNIYSGGQRRCNEDWLQESIDTISCFSSECVQPSRQRRAPLSRLYTMLDLSR